MKLILRKVMKKIYATPLLFALVLLPATYVKAEECQKGHAVRCICNTGGLTPGFPDGRYVYWRNAASWQTRSTGDCAEYNLCPMKGDVRDDVTGTCM